MLLETLLLWALLGPQTPEKSPTLAETTQFLTEKLPELATYSGKSHGTTINARVIEARADGCNFTMIARAEYSKDLGVSTTEEFNFPLGSIGQVEVLPFKYADQTEPKMLLLWITTKEGKKSISATSTEITKGYAPERTRKLTSMANLMFSSQENADRITKAFQHAVKLCSEKKEPF